MLSGPWLIKRHLFVTDTFEGMAMPHFACLVLSFFGSNPYDTAQVPGIRFWAGKTNTHSTVYCAYFLALSWGDREGVRARGKGHWEISRKIHATSHYPTTLLPTLSLMISNALSDHEMTSTNNATRTLCVQLCVCVLWTWKYAWRCCTCVQLRWTKKTTGRSFMHLKCVSV